MNGNRFYIKGNWGARQESPEELGQKMLHTIAAVREIDANLGPWWLVDFEEKDGIPLEDARPRIAQIVKGGAERDDDGEVTEGGIYHVAAESQDFSDPMSVSITARAGTSSSSYRLQNSVEFATGYDEIPDPSIVTYPTFKAIACALIGIWQPEIVRVYSWDLADLWQEAFYYSDPSWMTYLSAPLAARVTLRPGIITERTEDGGLFLIATEQTFDANQEEHIQAAAAISAVVAPLDVVLKGKGRS